MFNHFGLSQKITLLFSVILLVIFSILAYFTLDEQIRSTKNRITDQSKSFSSLSKDKFIQHYNLYYESGFYKFSELVASLMAMSEDLKNVRIFSVSGSMLFDSEETVTGKYFGNDRKASDQELLSKVQGSESTLSEVEINKIRYLEIVEPYVDEWGRHDYSIVYLFTYESLMQSIVSSLSRIVTVFILLYLLSSIFAILVSRKIIVQPVEKLLQGVNVVRDGNLNYHIDSSSSDEIGQLTKAFNGMVIDLGLSRREISQQNQKLELLVSEKTKELNEKVGELERTNGLMIGRELTMVELKKKITELEEQLAGNTSSV